MKGRRLPGLVLAVALAVFLAPPVLGAPAQEDASDWTPLAPGIVYRTFLLHGPNSVFVSRLDRADPHVTLDTVIAQGTLYQGTETVKGMAQRADGAINFWDRVWGNRNRVIVAVNGSFYDLATGVPQRGMVQAGWYAKRFDNYENGSGFGWKFDRTAFIGECVSHRPQKQTITYLETGATQPFDGINTPRGANQLIVYTPQYDLHTHTGGAGVEAVVEMAQPAGLVSPPGMVRGTIREVRVDQLAAAILFDAVVLSGQGRAADTLLAQARVGEEIGISQEISAYLADCVTPRLLSWANTYASLGGSYFFLENGEIQPFSDAGATARHPRTAIAYNESFVFFVVVDGRDPSRSVGMTIAELAAFTRETLEATWAIAQDGGGSSTMVVNGQVVNRPNVGLKCNRVLAPLVLGGTPGRREPEPTAAVPEATGNPCPRWVANGIMMVEVAPRELSVRFAPGEAVVTTGAAKLRLGPGSNYGALAAVPPGTQGTVVDHPAGLNGVFAKGVFWWKVAFGTQAGWVREDSLEWSSQTPQR